MSDRSKPMPGRCNAETGGGYCHATPKRGTTRCRLHGGTAQAFGQRLRAIDQAARDEIDAAITDAGLLDTRRPLAAIETVVSRTAFIPSDEYVRRYARRKLMASIPPELMAQTLADDTLRAELLEPTEEDLDAARLDLHERSVRMLATWSKRQVDAVRQLEWARVIRETALPLLGELGLSLSKLVRKHLPDEQAAAFIDEMRQEIRRVVGELAVVRDAK